MTTKMKASALGSMHTAGIYSDMTVDGPEIGTLVVIVDRAKNLPNRKTIGKQDPYCAARLGKEAKKTETDRRGGQTPRWDQELRFTVHDSPDYYQLKVSVFNDDKKTEIIGETWVNLQEIIIPGGGQNDLWHNLSCRGKYAGEIRIEITYYDTRPKEEKHEKVKQASTNGVDEGSREGLRGPRQPKAPVKRRPLPSDPVTGAPPPEPVEQAPPRSYQQPPMPDHVQTPPRGYPSPAAIPSHVQPSPRGPQPMAIPEHVQNVQTPPRGYHSPSYISSQSALQNVEYNTPTHRQAQPHSYGTSPNMNGYGTSPGTMPVLPVSPDERYDSYDPQSRDDYAQGHGMERYAARDESVNQSYRHDTRQPVYEMPEPHEYAAPSSPESPPPPPPVHRSINGPQQVSPAPAVQHRGSYNFQPQSRTINQYDTPPHRHHRQSVPAYTNPAANEGHEIATNDQSRMPVDAYDYEQPAPRHHSYDPRYNGGHGAMQPTVEDAPPTPGPPSYPEQRDMVPHPAQFNERQYDQVPSPAPLNLSGRGSVSTGHYAPSNQSHPYSNSSNGYGHGSPAASFSDHPQSVSSQTSYNTLPQQNQPQGRLFDDRPSSPYNTLPQQNQPQGRQFDDRPSSSYNTLPQQNQPQGRQLDDRPSSSDNYGLPQMPPSLVPGMDPTIAQEITDRIYAENRASKAGNSPRVRMDSAQQQPTRPNPVSYQQASAPTTPSTAAYDERQSRYAAGTASPSAQPRGVSPDTRTPMRKSVSPSPVPSDEARRLTGIPFGPDSYNALNPSLAGSTSATSLSAKYDTKVNESEPKIIMYDGREVDPSDHIPESNYAPLLETRGPKYASQQPDRNYRPPPAQPEASPGRKVLRQSGRPQSMAAPSPTYMNNSPQPDPSTPTGRHRLQKKTNRMSAQPAPHSSPLAPITPYQNNAHMPRSLPRAGNGDYPNENYAPQTYGNSPSHRGSAAPPIPAKIPVSPQGLPQAGAQGGDPWALLEEMKSIDLGTGRARRRY